MSCHEGKADARSNTLKNGQDAELIIAYGTDEFEFSTYLRSPRIVGEVFDEFHPEIATVEFWQAMKDGHQGGRRPDFFPYPHQYRFADD